MQPHLWLGTSLLGVCPKDEERPQTVDRNVDSSFIFFIQFMFPNSFIYDNEIFSLSLFLSQSMNKILA